MPTVATLNTIFTATYDKFESGVKGVRGTLGTFEKAIFSVKGALAGLGAGISLGVVAHEIGQTMENIDKTAKASDRLGVTTEALLGLEHAAKLANIGTEELEGGLTKMANTIETAVQGGKAQQKAFENLGLSASTLSRLPLNEAFEKIADSITALPSATERTAAAMDIFGKSGAGLLPLLSQGSKGIEETAAELDKLGGSFSRIDAAQVEAANDALTRVGEVFEGIKTQIAIGIAPFIELAAQKFTDWAGTAGSSGQIVINVLEGVAKGIGVIADVVDTVIDAFKFLQAAVTSAIGIIVSGLAKFAGALDYILNKIPGVESNMGGFLQNIADEIDKTANDEWAKAKESFAKPPPSANIEKFFADIRANATAAATVVANTAKKVNDVTANFSGLTKFFGTLKAIGVGAFEAIGHKMDEIADKIKIDQLTPLQQYTDKLHALQALQATGRLNDTEFAMAKMNALRDLASTLPEPNRRAGLQEFGTQAAFISQIGGNPLNTEKEILATAKRQEQIMKDQLAAFQKEGVVFSIP